MAWHRGWGFSHSKKLRKVDQDVRQTPPHSRDPSSDCVSPELVQQREGSTGQVPLAALCSASVLPNLLAVSSSSLPQSAGLPKASCPAGPIAETIQHLCSRRLHVSSPSPTGNQGNDLSHLLSVSPVLSLQLHPSGDKPATGLEADCEDATSPFRQDGILGKGMAGCIGTRFGRAGWKGRCTPVHGR